MRRLSKSWGERGCDHTPTAQKAASKVNASEGFISEYLEADDFVFLQINGDYRDVACFPCRCRWLLYIEKPNAPNHPTAKPCSSSSPNSDEARYLSNGSN